jgi:archaellum biogenesis ATPase FlaH
MELIILKNLLKKEPFLRKALPYLRPEYFNEGRAEKIVFEEIQTYVVKYNAAPAFDALGIAVAQRDDLFETDFKAVEELIGALQADDTDTDQNWLNDETEKFCQQKALHNAIQESIEIYSGKSKKDNGSIPKLLTDALSVTFDPNVGHDYLEDADSRYEYYHRTSQKYPFDLKYFNLATGGGLEPKTLNVILAGPKVGKTLMMCHMAASYLQQNYNVLYITMEMSQEKIAQRVEANLMDVTMDELMALPKDAYDRKISRVRQATKGKLIIKEYPTSTASATHFRALINELYLKKQFKPQIIIIDYINICTSSRLKVGGQGVNSYALIKSICEELRGLAVEYVVPIISATQLTRAGAQNSDPEMGDTSESWGLPQTVDELWAITTNEELYKLGQIAVKRLASRSGDVNMYKRFLLGINYGKMKLYDVEEQNLADSGYTQVVKSKTRQLEQDETSSLDQHLASENIQSLSKYAKFKNIGNVDLETGEIIN